MGYRVGMLIPGEPNLVYNGLVFATEAEASASGEELMSRWIVPSGYEVVEVAEEPNYTFTDGHAQPVPVMPTYNHAFDLAWAVPGSQYENAEDCLNNERELVLAELQKRVRDLTATDEYYEAIGSFDTYVEEPDEEKESNAKQ